MGVCVSSKKKQLKTKLEHIFDSFDFRINPNDEFTFEHRVIREFGGSFASESLIKKMIVGQKNTAGRNNLGKITVRHKGGGHQKKYRKINFIRNKDSVGIITSLEYDPFRTAFIAAVYDFLNYNYFYMIAPKNLNIGDIVKSGFNAEVKVGHSLTLMKIPVGSFIHNVSLKANKKAQLSRSAGTNSQLIEKTSKYCRIVLSSGKHKFLSSTCHATIGTVSNEFSFFSVIGKAGRNR